MVSGRAELSSMADDYGQYALSQRAAFEAPHPSVLAAARLLADEPARLEMGRRARESAVGRYSTNLVIPQYIDFYERVIASSKENPA